MHLSRLFTVTALLSLLLLSVTCYGQTSEEKVLAQAREDISDRKYYFATTWLERLLKGNLSTPHRKDALLLIIKGYNLSGRDAKAVPYVKTLIKEFPDAGTTLDPELIELAKASNDADSASIAPPPKPPAGENENASDGTAVAAPTFPGSVVKPPGHAPADRVATLQPKAAEAGSSVLPSANKERSTAAHGSTDSSPQKFDLPLKVSGRTPAVDTAAYYTVIDGTTSRKKLNALLKKVKAAGMKPIVREEKRNTGVFRLVLDCYGKRKTAEQARVAALKAKTTPSIIRDGDSYCLVVGSVKSEPAALQEQKRLAKKGVQAKIVRLQVPLSHFQLFLGRFSTEEDAGNAVKALDARGIAAKIQKTAD